MMAHIYKWCHTKGSIKPAVYQDIFFQLSLKLAMNVHFLEKINKKNYLGYHSF